MDPPPPTLMSDLFRNPKPGTVSEILRQRYMLFNTGEYLVTQHARALRYLHDFEAAHAVVTNHIADFFGKTRMAGISGRHDRMTEILWERRVRLRPDEARDHKSFLKQRFETGIRRIRKLPKSFDLNVPGSQAFYGFYLKSLTWAIMEWLRKERREKKHFVSLEEQPPDTSCPAGGFSLCDCIAMLAINDLLADQRDVGRRIVEEEGFDHADDDERHFVSKVRSNLRLLFSAHELAQTLDGVEVIRHAASLLENEEDRRLLLDHFTVAGPESVPELFIGISLDAPAVAEERPGGETPVEEGVAEQDAEQKQADEKEAEERRVASGEAARVRLLKCLSFIPVSAAIEEERMSALMALPLRQRSVLNAEIFRGFLSHGDEKLPDWSAEEWDRQVRLALRDLKYLHVLYRRSQNGKSLHLLLHDTRLTWDEMELLKLHLVEPWKRRNTLQRIAADRRVTPEFLKEQLLQAAKKIIKLKKQ